MSKLIKTVGWRHRCEDCGRGVLRKFARRLYSPDRWVSYVCDECYDAATYGDIDEREPSVARLLWVVAEARQIVAAGMGNQYTRNHIRVTLEAIHAMEAIPLP